MRFREKGSGFGPREACLSRRVQTFGPLKQKGSDFVSSGGPFKQKGSDFGLGGSFKQKGSDFWSLEARLSRRVQTFGP